MEGLQPAGQLVPPARGVEPTYLVPRVGVSRRVGGVMMEVEVGGGRA